MLNESTISKLYELKLKPMAKAFKEQQSDAAAASLSFEERFGLLVDSEWTNRRNNTLKRLIQKAQLKDSRACIEDIDYSPDRKLDKGLISKLATCSFIEDHLNVIITEKTGAGKTYLACALGNSACRNRYSVLYIRLPRLLTDLAISKGDGSYSKLMRSLNKVKLLIIDDWGLSPLDLNQSRDILEIMENRYQTSSIIFSSQLESSNRYELFSDSTIADAIMDRIIHNSYRIEADGDSMRRKRSTRL